MNHSFLDKKYPLGNALQLDLLIDYEKIKERVSVLARELEILYAEAEITIVAIMKGSFFLVVDLMRILCIPMQVEFLHFSSDGELGVNKNELEVLGIKDLDVRGKHILLVNDIFDVGGTFSWIYESIKQKEPKSLRSLVLLTKDVPHQTNYRPDFSLFDIEDRFVVGYGLGYKEYYRELSDIYAINP